MLHVHRQCKIVHTKCFREYTVNNILPSHTWQEWKSCTSKWCFIIYSVQGIGIGKLWYWLKYFHLKKLTQIPHPLNSTANRRHRNVLWQSWYINFTKDLGNIEVTEQQNITQSNGCELQLHPRKSSRTNCCLETKFESKNNNQMLYWAEFISDSTCSS
jgi:hypothetical protein